MWARGTFACGIKTQSKKKMFKICLIMGGGELPFEVLKNFKREEIFVICLKEAEIDYTKLANYNFVKESFVKIGSIFKLVKSKGIKNVCFAGRVKKPHFSSVRPDFKGFFLLFKILKSRIKGDNFILKTIVEFVEKNGINVKSVAEICGNLVMQEGILTSTKPSKAETKDALFAMNLIKSISEFDVGQAVVMQEGVVLGVEAIEGTDELIKRCGSFKYPSKNKPILVKSPKLKQTLKIDMPVIGFETIKNLKESGFSGVFLKAGSSLFLEQQKCVEFANQNGIFISGIN